MFLRLCFLIRDHVLPAQDFWRNLKTATTFWSELFTRVVLLCIFNQIGFKQLNGLKTPKYTLPLCRAECKPLNSLSLAIHKYPRQIHHSCGGVVVVDMYDHLELFITGCFWIAFVRVSAQPRSGVIDLAAPLAHGYEDAYTYVHESISQNCLIKMHHTYRAQGRR